jgi:hypothetical protein
MFAGQVISNDDERSVLSATFWDGRNYHAEMRTKYDVAARLPWLPVEPNPLDPARASVYDFRCSLVAFNAEGCRSAGRRFLSQ